MSDVLKQLDKPARESKQFATFRLALVSVLAFGLASLGVLALGREVPTDLVLGVCATLAALGGGTAGARSWHDRAVRIAALQGEQPK